MKQHANVVVVFSIMLFFSTMGCKKFVEIPPPVTQLGAPSVFSNSAAATAALTAIYSEMQNESFNMSSSCGLLSDELTNYSTSSITNIQKYTNSLKASNNSGPWNRAYSYIFQANSIIEGVKENNGISLAVRQQLIGESKFIRAFWIFYLANLYGDVPLVTSTDYTVNKTIARTLKADVYVQIIKDLKEAEIALNSKYVNASDTVVTTDRVRPTKWAAKALLARVYLYTGDYANAVTYASEVINNTELFALAPELKAVFLANSQEAIWQLAVPLPTFINTADGAGFILISTGTLAISPELMNSFEAGDSRKAEWVGSFTGTAPPITTYYFPYKYKVRQSDVVTEYTMVLRLAEQYLIRSEALVALGTDIPGAIADLDTIRSRAGLPHYSGSMNKDSLLSAVLHERQTELFTEWGHRWFDLIRTKKINSVMGIPGNVCQMKGGIWSSNWQLFPIPQSEINVDVKLTQNEGY